MITFSSSSRDAIEARMILLTEHQTHPLLKKTLEKGDLFPVIHDKKTILFVGLGEKSKLSFTEIRMYVRKAILSGFLKSCKEVEIIPHQDQQDVITSLIEGCLLGTYTWDKYKTKDKNDTTVKNKHIIIVAHKKDVYDEIIMIAEGVNHARNLVNENADIAISSYLEKVVKDAIKLSSVISLEVLNGKQLKAKGLNFHFAVNQGSQKEPKLIIVKYTGAAKNAPYTALVGKGITYDTGGLNLKPSGSIETMKIDMSGAAAVCGILKNTIHLKLKKNILFVLAIAENAIGPGAYKPGDVLVGYAGKSVEIGNTDAEGRLVLADAISYLIKNYKPATIIDIATLTGACVVALGFDYTGLFSNSDSLANQLLHAATITDDRAWRLPIYPEMKEYIKSPIADLKNTSTIKGAGASTAATFLNQFTGETTWAHLDIAGTAYVDGTHRMYFGHGATGAGVRLLTHYLQHTT